MIKFWETLAALLSEYTVADTANVFTIIEGLATVVAAVGAIIAVVVTKKIAASQIEIAKEQNKISSKQAEIAAQQNKIALFEIKHESYAEILKLLCFADSISSFLDEKNIQELRFASQVFTEMKKPSIILNSMATIFGFAYNGTESDKDKWGLFISKLKKTEYLINKSLYLFDYINPDDVQKITFSCQEFLVNVLNASSEPLRLAKAGADYSLGRVFISACHEFMEKYEKKIDADLLI